MSLTSPLIDRDVTTTDLMLHRIAYQCGYNLASRSMDLQAVAFPALVAADDGWYSTCLRPKNYPCGRQSAIKKYNRRRVVLHDSNDRSGQVDGINPAKPAGLFAKLVGRKVTVSLSLRPVSEAPFQFVCDVTEEESMYSWLS
jgi:hypothetical protein